MDFLLKSPTIPLNYQIFRWISDVSMFFAILKMIFIELIDSFDTPASSDHIWYLNNKTLLK